MNGWLLWLSFPFIFICVHFLSFHFFFRSNQGHTFHCISILFGFDSLLFMSLNFLITFDYYQPNPNLFLVPLYQSFFETADMKGKEMNMNEWSMIKQTNRKCIGMEWKWLAIQAPSFFTFPSWVLSCIVSFLFFPNWYWLHSKSIVVHISATWCHHVVILHRAGSKSELQHLSLPTLWKSCATMAEASVASGRCLALTIHRNYSHIWHLHDPAQSQHSWEFPTWQSCVWSVFDCQAMV